MSNTVATAEAEAVLSPRRQALDKAKRWSSLLAKFVSVQIIVQVIGLVAGLFLIRTLSQKEYAYFTLANTVQATLLLLADVGVGSALSATGGRVWQDRQRFSELIATGLYIRKKLSWIGGAVALPVLYWMLIRNGTSVAYALSLTVAVLVGANFRLTNDVLILVPRMYGRIDQLQKLDLWPNLFRLVIISGFCLVFVNAAIGILVASLCFGLQYILLRRWTAETVNLQASVNPEDTTTISRTVKQQTANVLYYCVQGQLTVFLISIFGNVHTIAELGALGRLAMLFSVVGSVMSSIVIPKFVRCQNKHQLKKIWWQIMFATVLLATGFFAMAVLVPKPLLWLLGSRYAHLEQEFAYVAFSTVINMIVGTIQGLNFSRAWMRGVWLSIPLTIGAQIALLPLVDLSTLQGVVLLSSLPAIVGVLPYLHRTYNSIKYFSEAQ